MSGSFRGFVARRAHRHVVPPACGFAVPRSHVIADSAIRRRYVFHGTVQGVGFRATTEAIARGHDVSGYVRNQSDGTVELVAEGSPDAVRAFVEEMRSRMSRCVEDVEEAEYAGEERFTGFGIRR